MEGRGDPVTDCRLLRWARCIEHPSAAAKTIPASSQGLHVWQPGGVAVMSHQEDSPGGDP